MVPLYFIPEPVDNNRLAHLCGPMDENLRQIAAALDVTIVVGILRSTKESLRRWPQE